MKTTIKSFTAALIFWSLALCSVGCSKDGSEINAPPQLAGQASFGGVYPMRQDEPTWSAGGLIAYRDNGILCADSLGVSFQIDAAKVGIWVLDLDSNQRHRILPGGFSPTWSHDGRTLAYELAGQIGITDSLGGYPSQVTSGGRNFHPAWSVDDGGLLFESNVHVPTYDIEVVRRDGTGGGALCTSEVGGRRAPSWSPDGRRVVCSKVDDASFVQIYVLQPPACTATRLTNLTATAISRPAYSPDGSRILFAAKLEGVEVPQVWVMDADGSALRQVTSLGGWNPCWSPNGEAIVFARPSTKYSEAYGVLWIMDLNTRIETQLTQWLPCPN